MPIPLHLSRPDAASEVVANVSGKVLRKVILANVDAISSKLHTDQWKGYIGIGIGQEFGSPRDDQPLRG